MKMAYLDFILAGCFLIYFLGIFQFFLGLFRLKKGSNNDLHPVSVIIPARNEEAQIQKCVQSVLNQNYPAALVEILVVDDHSTDATAWQIEALAKDFSQVKLIFSMPTTPGLAPKKQALLHGILASKNEIILTLDADCVVPSEWLRTMISFFDKNTGVVVGPVLYQNEESFFQRLQSLEFLALVTAGAGSLGMKRPLIANGANLAYRKKVFYQVNGFSGIAHVPSGDDDLLIQKIAAETLWQIQFAADLSAGVQTCPASTLAQFFEQRTRWASKITEYKNFSVKLFLALVFCFYLLLFLCVPLIWFELLSLKMAGLIFAMKCLVDFGIVWKGCRFFRRLDLLKYFLIAELLQIPYILWVSLRGTLGNFRWKGREIRKL